MQSRFVDLLCIKRVLILKRSQSLDNLGMNIIKLGFPGKPEISLLKGLLLCYVCLCFPVTNNNFSKIIGLYSSIANRIARTDIQNKNNASR